MATIPTSNQQQEDELQRDMEQLAPSLGRGGIPGGLQTGQSWSTPNNANRPRANRPGFVSLDQYANANQDATSRLGNKVFGDVQEAGAQASRLLSGAANSLYSQIGNSAVKSDPGLLNQLQSDPTKIQGADRDRLAAMRDAQYKGPSGAIEDTADYGNISAALQNAKQKSELSKTTTGVNELSKQFVQGARTSGGARLDSQLLGRDTTTLNNLANVRSGIDTLDPQLQTASRQGLALAGQARAETDKTRETTRGALTSAQDALEKALEENKTRKQQAAFYDAVRAQNALKSYNDPALKGIDTATVQNATNGLSIRPGDNVTPDQLDPGLHKLTPQDIAALQALPLADQQRLMQARADQRIAGATTGLPTAGAQGRYYENNDPTRGSYQDTSIAGNAPEFIHGGSGGAALPGFEQYLGSHGAAAPSADVLRSLGLTQQQWSELAPLFPVGEYAHAAAFGTQNVNPYSFLEQYGQGVGDLSRFLNVSDPNQAITRGNAASTADFDRAEALRSLSGDLGRQILDPSQRAQAGTAPSNLLNFDLAGANKARDAALEQLAQRAGTHIAGNARSGGDTLIKKIGANPIQNPSQILSGVAGGLNNQTLNTLATGQRATPPVVTQLSRLEGLTGLSQPMPSPAPVAQSPLSQPAPAPASPAQLDPGLHALKPADLAALRALSPADLQRLMDARQAQLRGK